MEEEGSDAKWHLKREVSTGDVILACTIIIAIGIPMMTWAVGINSRVSVLEEKVATEIVQEARDNQQESQTLRESVSRIEGDVHDIQSYLLAHSAVQPAR